MKILKSSIIFLLIPLSFSFISPLNELNWITLDAAQERIKEEPKAILIDFTADWCGWCKVMDKKTFSDIEVSKYMNENFYSVKLDYESSEVFEFFGNRYTAKELAAKYRVTGLPTILLVTPDNKKTKKVIGYKKPEPFLKHLKAFAE